MYIYRYICLHKSCVGESGGAALVEEVTNK